MSSLQWTAGLMFTETTSPRVRSMVATWMLQARGRHANPTEYRNSVRGCSSLQEMVLRWIIWNIDIVEVESLQYLGWHYSSKLYDELKRTDTITFNTWDLFRMAFPEEIDRHHHFNVFEREAPEICGQEIPPAQLPSIVKRLATLSTTTLTSLCLKGFDLTLDNLMSLIQVKPLSSLVLTPRRFIYHTSARADERYFKGWGRAVRENGAFKKLRLLVLGNIDIQREAILQGVSNFPALTLVGTSRWRWETKSVQKTCGSWHFLSYKKLVSSVETAQEQHPDKLWTDNSTTIDQKMRTLYGISTKLLRSTPPDSAANLSVGITYWSNSSGMIIHDRGEWFCRDLTGEAPPSAQRSDINSSSGKERVADANKKRKVREDQQIDVGSLLRSFT